VGPDGSVYVTYQTTEETWEVFAAPDDFGDNFWGWHTGDTANLVKIAPDDGTIIFDTTFSDTHDGGNRQSGVYLSVGNSLAVGSDGAAYVPLAVDSPNGGATLEGFAFAGDPDYVVKLAADGTRAFMAEVPLFPNAIAVDPQGDFFIAGDTTLDGLFTSPGAFQAHHPASTGHFNPYIAEYDPSGQGVIAATYLGSPEGGYSSGSREYVSAIALSPVDPNLLYVVGSTVSPNFPVQSYLNLSRLQPFQSSLNLGAQPDPNFGPDSDAFVAALDTRSMSLVSSTLLGGSGMDAATSVAVDRAGNVYVAGETAPHATLTFTMDGSPDALLLGPSDFPTVDPLMPAYTKGYALNDNGTQSFAAWSGAAAADIFVSKFDSSLESLEFSTYLGGSGHDVVPQIAVDDSGTIHVAGMTAGFGTGVTQQSYAYGPYTGYYYKATGVTDDFPTLHADQPQFGGGFLNVENVLGDGTDLLGYSGFGATYSIDLPVDGFLLAIDQPAALKETLKDSNGGPVGSLAPGEEFSGVVATFTDPRLDVDPSEFTATIDWGDGKVDTGSADGVGVIRDPHGSGVFDVTGGHSFAKPGAYPILVSVADTRAASTAAVTPGSNRGSGPLSPQTNRDLAPRIFNQGETAITVDPNNPNRLFAVATDTQSDLVAAISSDGGATWSTEIIATGGSDGLLPALSDERAAFDAFGNLFLTYIDSTGNNIVVAASRDGGKTFHLVGTFSDPGGADVDQPAIATGPGTGGGSTVWVSFYGGGSGSIQVIGLPVTGPLDDQYSQIGDSSQFFVPPDPNAGGPEDFMGLAVGATGQVMITFRQPAFTPGASIYASVDLQGLDGAFGAPVKITATKVGGGVGSGEIPAHPRGIGDEADLAWDQKSGRAYLVYTDAPTLGDPANGQGDPNTHIYLRYSDDNGASWSGPVQVDNDTGDASRFLPALALDPTSGDVAVSWYDTRATRGTGAQYFVAVSHDGGLTFASNLPVSLGISDPNRAQSPSPAHDFAYGDYSGLAFAGGRLWPAWADNSSALPENPQGASFDLASANLAVIDVTQPGVLKEVPVTATAGVQFTGVVARFNDFRNDATAGEFTATIDWGDATTSTGTVSLDPSLNNPNKLDPVFDVVGTHTFDKPGAYPILVTITDARGLNPQTDIDLSHALNSQAEGSIAVNPANPKQLFAVSVDGNGVARTPGAGGLFSATSIDGGVTWVSQPLFTTSNGPDAPPPALGDPRAVFDQFGNLFLSYVDSTGNTAVVVLSTDGGQSFRRVAAFTDAGGVDQPQIAVGADTSGNGGTVWVSFERDANGAIYIAGAPVSGKLGPADTVAFTLDVPVAAAPAAAGSNTSQDFMGLAVGPSGQVVITYKQPALVSDASAIFAVLDPGGLGTIDTFATATPVQISAVNLGGGDGGVVIPADARGVGGETDLVWDRTRGDNGRLYLIYTDSTTVAAPSTVDTNIFLRFSDDGGATWSAPIQVNNDPPGSSQFFPSLALDPTSGDIGVGWYDTRNAQFNVFTQYFVAVSNDGGRTFATNLQVSTGTSNSKVIPAGVLPSAFEYGDYTGIAFLNGVLHPVWADNSSALLENPAPLSGAFHQGMDLATALVGVIDVRAPQLTVTPLAINAAQFAAFHGAVATFTFPDPTYVSTDFSATIDWGDDSGGPVAADLIFPTTSPTTYTVIGTHTYVRDGAYGAWKPINATDAAPVLTPNSSSILVSHSNPVAASTLFTASDQDGDGIAQYDFWGTGTAGGHWLLNGNALPNSQDNFINASQLSQVTYQGGAGAETIWMRASDGIQYGTWKFINATDTAPAVTPTNVNITVSYTEPVAASTLFKASDADGDSIAQFDFWDSSTAGGHWLLSGQALPNGQDNYVNAAQLSQVTYQGGAGTETIWVRASDGLQYGAWTSISASSSFAPASGTSVTSALESDATSIDATFSSAGGVKSVAFRLDYDPELVTVADAEPGADLPDSARISFRTAATEDGAEAYITVTSEEPIPAGTVNLASVSITPRYSGRQHEGLRRLHVHDVNGGLFAKPEKIRIRIDDVARTSSEMSGTEQDVDFLDRYSERDSSAPKIRVKILAPEASTDNASSESILTEDPAQDWADLRTPVRIAIGELSATDTDLVSKDLRHSRRWKLDWSTNDSATNLPEKVRITFASLAIGADPAPNP
jgi:hypothetical protein